MYKSSFPPILGKEPKILILGSLPGDKSIALQEYYGHPQNRFWKLMHLLFKVDITNGYATKVQGLMQANVAVWDVAHTAFRPGSMDNMMAEEIPNKIKELLKENLTIQHVCFNGKKAEAIFKQFFQKQEGISYHCLPSTSPANAGCNMECLQKAWSVIL